MSVIRRGRIALAVCLLPAHLGGCGGGGNSADGSTNSPGLTSNQPSSGIPLSGVVFKGPAVGTEVCAYAVSHGAKGARLGNCTQTDSQGHFTLQLPASSDVLIEASNGRYIDEASGTEKPLATVLRTATFGLTAGGRSDLPVTPFTEIATAAALSSTGGLATESFRSAASRVAAVFEVPDLVSTLPVSASTRSDPATTPAVKAHGLALAALSWRLNATAAPSLATLLAQTSAALASDVGVAQAQGLQGRALAAFVASARNQSGVTVADLAKSFPKAVAASACAAPLVLNAGSCAAPITSFTCSDPVVGQALSCRISGVGITSAVSMVATGCSGVAKVAGGTDSAQSFTCTPVQAGAVQITVSDGAGSGRWSLARTVTASAAPCAGNAGVASPCANELLVAPTVLAASGQPNAFGATNVQRPTFSGSAPVGATIIVLNGTTTIATGTGGADGVWRATASVDLAPGAHTISFTSTAAGKTSQSANLALNVDVAAPLAPAISRAGRAGDATGQVAGTAEPLSLVMLTWPDTSQTTAQVDGSGHWESKSSAAQVDGGTVTAIAADRAGNKSAPVSASLSGTANTKPATRELNDTGIVAGATDYAGALTGCGTSTLAAQDCATGRDVRAKAGTLSRLGFGAKGFDWTKIANDGAELPATAVLGSDGNQWACTRDNVTGLVWEVKTADGGLRDLRAQYTNWGDGRAGDSGAYVKAVNTQGLCGHSDWRLPSPEELQGIVNYGTATPGPTIDDTALPNSSPYVYWSSQQLVGMPEGTSWGSYLNAGNLYYHWNGFPRYVRLVRGEQAGDTVGRYTVARDGSEWVVRDARTGLTWRHCPEGMASDGVSCQGTATTQDWLSAAALATAQATASGKPWRLPNVKELASIADRTRREPAIDTAIFPATPFFYDAGPPFLQRAFWTSSPVTGEPGNNWYVNFYIGGAGNGADRREKHYVRLVRSPD